jgi:hypothetical protein
MLHHSETIKLFKVLDSETNFECKIQLWVDSPAWYIVMSLNRSGCELLWTNLENADTPLFSDDSSQILTDSLYHFLMIHRRY